MKKLLGFCTVILLLTQPVSAHDMWVQESAENFFNIVLGHVGQCDPYEPERLKEIVGYTENGWPVRLDIDREKQGCRFIPDEAFCAIGALLDNRYWLKTTDGWRNQREHEDYKILEEGRSYKFTKHVARWCDLLAKPLGQRFEIIPLQDPTRLKQGDRLPVRIFFEGKPAIGARVAKTSNMEQTHRLEPVQAEAPFIVTIGPPGLQLINAKLAVPIKKGHVTWFAASLTFRTNQTTSK